MWLSMLFRKSRPNYRRIQILGPLHQALAGYRFCFIFNSFCLIFNKVSILKSCYSWQIIMNSDLEELRELGSGTFGTVYHGKWRGTDVAIKRINDRCFSGKPLDQERMVRLFIILVNNDPFYG